MKAKDMAHANRGDGKIKPPITVGIVEDVSDAFQMGKVRVRCNAWGDTAVPTNQLPFARFCSPFGGISTDLPRGVNEDVSQGEVAYGQWSVPKVGSRVVCMLIDGDHDNRVWVGSIPDLFYPHTMPHGRYLEGKTPVTSAEAPIEPYATNSATAFSFNVDSAEYATRIMDRQVAAVRPQDIGGKVIASLKPDEIEQIITNPDGSVINRTQGYTARGSEIYSVTTPGFHSFSMDDDSANCRVRFRTTSGHQIILDDTNERIYISTAKGKTWIEIDEKGTIDIYGSEDISLNADSDINISAKKTVRIAGGEGIHLASGKDIRMHASDDLHVKSDSDIKMHSDNIKMHTDTDLVVKVDGTHQEVAGSVVINSEDTYDLTVAATYTMKSDAYDFDGTNITITGDFITSANVSAAANITAGGIVSGAVITGAAVSSTGAVTSTGGISSSGPIFSSADVVAGTTSLANHSHQYLAPKHPLGPATTPPASFIPSGGGSAGTATPPETPSAPAPASPAASTASAAEELSAYFVTRVPQHEPYARSYLNKDETDKDTTGDSTLGLFASIESDIDSVAEYPSTNPSVGTGSEQRGKNFDRNSKWRR